MRRIYALMVVLVTWGMLASVASASVESKRVNQSRAEVVSYWTPERMRNAKPADRQIGGKPVPNAKGGKPGTGTKPGSAVEVTSSYTTFPTSTNGKVFFTENGLNYVCSGTALASGNESVVWTAGHCVNEGPGDYVTNWAFVPAYKDGAQPLGKFAAKSLLTTSQWASSGNFSYDLGAAVVSPNAQTLQATVGGGRTPAFGAASQLYSSFGYPAASPFNGQRLWHCDSGLYMNDGGANGDPQTMGIQCNMTGGSSGGGWIGNDGRLYSVNSYGYSSLKNVMFGPRQGSVAQDLYNAAQTTP
jgi:hypothetical protein